MFMEFINKLLKKNKGNFTKYNCCKCELIFKINTSYSGEVLCPHCGRYIATQVSMKFKIVEEKSFRIKQF